jgi:dienelactone hydrolase
MASTALPHCGAAADNIPICAGVIPNRCPGVGSGVRKDGDEEEQPMSARLCVLQCEVEGLGHLYAPAGEGPWPAILLLHGSEGALGWLCHREAALFAAHGYLALPFGYSAADTFWSGGDVWEAELDQTEAALAALRDHRLCNGKVGVYGWSRGGEHALLIAALTAEAKSQDPPDAVAAHAPPDRVEGAWRNLFYRHRETADPPRPPPIWGFDEERFAPGLAAWRWRGAPILPGAAIAIEAFDGPVFLSVGDADELWPADMARRLADRLRTAGRPVDLHVYAGQGHMPDPATWNTHFARLLSFFDRALGDAPS